MPIVFLWSCKYCHEATGVSVPTECLDLPIDQWDINYKVKQLIISDACPDCGLNHRMSHEEYDVPLNLLPSIN